MSAKAKESVIYSEYFNHTDVYKAKFGPNTIVLMQVGSFIEVYGLKGDPMSSQIEKYAEICGLNIAEKTHQFRGKTVLMCGFRDYCIDSYLATLMASPDAFTVVLFMQEEEENGENQAIEKRVHCRRYIARARMCPAIWPPLPPKAAYRTT